MRHKRDPPLYLAAVNSELTFHGMFMHALLHQIIPLHQKLEKEREEAACLQQTGYLPGESWSGKVLRELFSDQADELVPS